MGTPEIKINEDGSGHFFILDENKQIAEMVFRLVGTHMTILHTEVLPEYEGKGLAKQLLNSMVAYVRQHQLSVIPLCPYVHAQFKRHSEDFADIWKH